ncbi:hypothetical protein COHA_001613 [Chlorella ohadii]|uniref:Uncharacterized protein n=1 Tax=Chlorella ohadii TaxID=2649997 RepID=A0AAD5DZ57_9CHLO|nr:hypothetical protein COHA_001613 [Chlorella ohadii]
MYLDVGQRHFHAYRCPACGMLYARGTDADERLHAAFHASATQGPRYQGWAGERVVQLDGSKGRVLLFGSADQGRPRKQLADLCSFLEEQMGLSKGWLLQAPLTVLLYVSAARRVQGFVAAEPIKEAYCARPSLPPAAAQGMLSCGSAVQPASGSGAAHAADAAATVAPFEGHPTAAAAAAQAHVATSGRSLLSVTLSTGAAAAECSSSAAAEGAGGGAPAAAAPAAAEAGDGEVAAAAGCTPGLPTSLQQQQQAQPEAQQAQQQLQQTQQPPVLPPLELDRSRRVRAVCGVRLMWVSLEARRRGLASRLLDCCRSHFMPGYVLSRHELAFSAPTDDGRAFIEQYAGSRKFLVYE